MPSPIFEILIPLKAWPARDREPAVPASWRLAPGSFRRAYSHPIAANRGWEAMENGTKTKNFERWNAADQQLPPAVLGRSSQNLRPALNHNCNSNLSVDWCELVVKASQTLSSLLKPSQTNIAGTHEPNESTPPLPLLGRGGGGTRRGSRAQARQSASGKSPPL